MVTRSGGQNKGTVGTETIKVIPTAATSSLGFHTSQVATAEAMQVASASILMVPAVRLELSGLPRYKLAPCKRRSQGKKKILFPLFFSSFFSFVLFLKRVSLAPFQLLSPEDVMRTYLEGARRLCASETHEYSDTQLLQSTSEKSATCAFGISLQETHCNSETWSTITESGRLQGHESSDCALKPAGKTQI